MDMSNPWGNRRKTILKKKKIGKKSRKILYTNDMSEKISKAMSEKNGPSVAPFPDIWEAINCAKHYVLKYINLYVPGPLTSHIYVEIL